MTMTMDRIMLATGISLIFMMVKPVASRMMPPQALKSLIMTSVVSGRISLAE